MPIEESDPLELDMDLTTKEIDDSMAKITAAIQAHVELIVGGIVRQALGKEQAANDPRITKLIAAKDNPLQYLRAYTRGQKDGYTEAVEDIRESLASMAFEQAALYVAENFPDNE